MQQIAPILSGLKSQVLIISTVSEGLGSRNDIAEWSGLELFLGFQSRYQLRHHHLKATVGLEELLPKWPTHVAGKLVLMVGGSPQFLTMWASPKPAWVSSWYNSCFFPEGETQKRISNKPQFFISYSLILHTITSALFWLIEAKCSPHGRVRAIRLHLSKEGGSKNLLT